MLSDLWTYEFLRNAWLAAALVAMAAAVVGYFLTSAGLTYTGHALPNIGFSGAAGAVLLGIAPLYGLLTFTLAAALVLTFVGREARERDLGIGIVMAAALGLGLLFLTLYSGFAQKAYGILFGSILGISGTEVRVTALMSVGVVTAAMALGRPLLFATFDPATAAARGLPVRFLHAALLGLAAVAVSLSVLVTGAMLVFTLLIGPAATAQRLTRSPWRGILMAVALGQVYVAASLTLAVETQTWPVSFFVAALSFVVYIAVRLFRRTPWAA